MRFIFVLLLIFVWVFTSAQKKMLNVWALPEAGVNAGALSPAADFRFTAGLNLGKLKLGAGVAYDEYRDPSYPVYVQARWQMQWRRWNPFVFSSAGYNLRSGTDSMFTWFGQRVETYRGGLYGEVGLGLALKVRKQERLYISLTQSYKRSSSTFLENRWLGPGNLITVPTTEVYRMNRLGIRAGWRFGK